ncbi:MAG: sulfocyanin-like copper-binding protein [Gemmatimonadales bacterium]
MLSALVISVREAGAQQPAAVAVQSIDPRWMTADSAARRVTFALTAGLTPFNGALNFNGFRDGELTFVVPAGWSVVVNFLNQDGMLSHSAEVIEDKQPVPLRAVDPAILRAYTANLEQGVAFGGGKDVMRFTANPPGNYLFFCAVPGHGAAGMWTRLQVDAAATTPRMVYTPKPAAPTSR